MSRRPYPWRRLSSRTAILRISTSSGVWYTAMYPASSLGESGEAVSRDAECMKGFSRESLGKGLFRPRKSETAALQRGEGGGIFSRQPDATDGPFRRIMHHTNVPEPCENDEPLIEYVDERDRPLLIAPSSDAFPLRKKAVCAVLCDRRGRAFVRRRMSEEGMETWDISAETFVRFRRSEGRSRRARRTGDVGPVQCTLGGGGFRGLQACRGNCLTHTVHCRTSGGLPPVSLPEGHFLDREELEGMTETFPDLFSPALLWAIQTGCLWKHRGPRVSTRSINPCTFRDRPV